MQIGRKLYYDKLTGNIIVDTGEMSGDVRAYTISQDITNYKVLSQRERSTFDVLELDYGQYAEEFATGKSFRINPTTKKLEFSDALPIEPGIPPTPKPISEKFEELEALWLYDSMMKDLAIEEANAMQADLMYQLMLKGVI